MNKKIIELAGWYGTFAIIGAYALTSFGIIQSDNLIYQFLNLTGGVGVLGASLSKKAYQPAVLNATWSVIALIAILNIIF